MTLPLPLLSGRARSLPLQLLATATFPQKIRIFCTSLGPITAREVRPQPCPSGWTQQLSISLHKSGLKGVSFGLVYRYFTATLSAATWALRYHYRYFFSKVAPLLKIATFSGSALFLAVATSAALNALLFRLSLCSLNSSCAFRAALRV